MGALSFFKETIFAEEYAAREGFLQSIDPRIKVITFSMMLITAVVIKDILLLLCIYSFCLLLACCSKINLGFFLKRTWVFIPLFSLFIALPAMFSVFTPGESVVTLRFFGIVLIITRPGLFGAILFVTRVVTSVSLVILLSLTTKHFALMRVLRILRIPQIFVMTLSMCYRYIYLFVEVIEDTHRAIKSRVGVSLHYKKGQSIVAWSIASLWQRSNYLNEEVYKAMLSGGYRGEAEVSSDFKTDLKDWIWLSSVVIIFSFILYLNYLTRS